MLRVQHVKVHVDDYVPTNGLHTFSLVSINDQQIVFHPLRDERDVATS